MKNKKIILAVSSGLAIIILAAYAFPYLYLVLTSFKPSADVISIPPTFLPKEWSLENYKSIENYPYLPRTFLNSLIIAIFSTILTLIISIPAAYGISRYNTRYGQIFLIIALVARLIPYISVAVPLFLIFKRIGIVGSYPSVIIGHMTVSIPFAIWLLSSFFQGIPSEIEEAARIDGCSRLSALVKVILPIMLGGVGTTAIFSFLASWNDFLFALMLSSPITKTAPIAISEFNSQHGVMWGTMTSLATLFSLPVILISFFFQKNLIAGSTAGAVKG